MTDNNVFSDQDLSCYLDGEVSDAVSEAIAAAVQNDPALSARLDEMKAGQDAFAAAMQAALAEAPAMPDLKPPLPEPANSPLRVGFAGVAVGAALGAVAAIGLAWNLWQAPAPGWKAVVASYQSLYVTETLTPVDQSPAEQLAELHILSEGVGIDLTMLPEVAGLTYKRGQQLGFRGKPLAQLTFLTADGGPVALCIIRTGGETSPGITAEVLSGLDAYSWTDNGFGVLLVGPKGEKGLENAAEMFRSALKDV